GPADADQSGARAARGVQGGRARRGVRRRARLRSRRGRFLQRRALGPRGVIPASRTDDGAGEPRMSDGSRGAPIALLTAFACCLSGTAGGEEFEPRQTASGNPDFNGIWQAMNEANWIREPAAPTA